MTTETEDGYPAIHGFTVLYDAGCPLCRHVRSWLERQWQLVPLEFVPAGSEQAAQRFPDLDQARTLREITVISDGGEVYEAAAAWVVCLWALKGRRAMAHRFSSPTGARLAPVGALKRCAMARRPFSAHRHTTQAAAAS
jgi:predicted DCC family thiol-disulfide oxidoreductase YuxK